MVLEKWFRELGQGDKRILRFKKPVMDSNFIRVFEPMISIS